MIVRIMRIHERAVVPEYQSAFASGCDVCACLENPIVLGPLERSAIPTGLAVEIPRGFEIQVRPRSGFAIKSGITVINAPGTIDSDYRGEVRVLVVNLSADQFVVEHGMRIAQLVLSRTERIDWLESSGLGDTGRGAGGFGSTGLKS